MASAFANFSGIRSPAASLSARKVQVRFLATLRFPSLGFCRRRICLGSFFTFTFSDPEEWISFVCLQLRECDDLIELDGFSP